MLKLYTGNTAPLGDRECYEKNFRLLDTGRQEKIKQYRMADDRMRGLAAGLLLREALSREGIGPDICIRELKGGKPVLDGGRFFFNISHAGTYAVCALSDCEVGVDIEEYIRFEGKKERNRKVAERIMTPEEWVLWSRTESEPELLKIWTRKESFAKLTGKGLACDFAGIDTVNAAFYQEKDFADGYHLSVCTWEKQNMEEFSIAFS